MRSLSRSRNGEVDYYLDTSALVKRYVAERGSDVVDEIFSDVYRGIATITLSYWNVAEAAVVYDKYERRLGLDAKKILRDMLRELRTLVKLQRAVLIGLSPSILRNAVKLVLKHHIYVADAIQIASAIRAGSNVFVTGDRDLARIAEAEGLKTLYLG